MDEVSGIGFSAADAVAAIGEERSAPMLWTVRDEDTDVTTSLASSGGTAELWDYERAEGYEGELPASCVDELRVPVDLFLTTDDGRFDEVIETQARFTSASEAVVRADHQLADLEGSYTPEEVDPSAYQYIWLGIELVFDDAAAAGIIKLVGESVQIRAGYAKSPELYAKNARPKRLEVVLLGSGWAPPVQGEMRMNLPVLGRHEVTLADVDEWQELPLPTWEVPAGYAPAKPPGFTVPEQRPSYLALRVLDAYAGTTWEDLCITELRATP